jgi:hypothetical protein
MPSSYRSSLRLARKSWELALAAPEVITHRLMLAATTGTSPSSSDRREFVRMSAEKVFAFNESWHAMTVALINANAHALSPRRWWESMHDVSTFASSDRAHRRVLDLLHEGLTPVHRRAVANAKRLRKNAARRAKSRGR